MRNRYLEMKANIKIVEDQELGGPVPPSIAKYLDACYKALERLKPVIDFSLPDRRIEL